MRRPPFESPRSHAKDRRRKRRTPEDRRASNSEYDGPERREGERRTVADRRQDDASSFSREDAHRIQEFVTKTFLPKKRPGRLGITCPQCRGELVLKTPVRWAGGVTVLEVVCRGCSRRTYWRS